jgi:K+-sensing histidine kinase KdpD
MEFRGKLHDQTQGRVDDCDVHLKDPARLATLERTGLMDSPREEAFDRLARLAADILKVPLTIISLVGDKKQFFKAGYGLPPPYDELREVPIDASICRYTLSGEEIIASDAAYDSLLMYHPTTEPWGITAFMAIPMKTSDGHVLGAFCAVDDAVRNWTPSEVAIMRDLTASVMTEIHLRMQIDELGAERKLREQFVATLTHDLLNPIGVAKGSADLLRYETNSPEEQQQLLRMIAENMDRAETMIRDLLNVTSVRVGGEILIHPQNCNLAELVRSTVESLTQIHGRNLVVKGPGELHGIFDPLIVRRMIENLVGNAVKYGAKDRPVTIAYDDEGESVCISVHNEGEPIAAEYLARIFEPFNRGDITKLGINKGWGIGLALIRAFASAHRGTVHVNSRSGDGTTFIISLPK